MYNIPSILRCRTLMLWHVPQSKMFFCFFPPYSRWMLWEKMLSCKVWGMRRALVRWVMQAEKARRGEKITSPGFSFFFFFFFHLKQVVEIRVMKGIFGALCRLAFGGVALVYPDQWWRWFRVVFATVGYGPAGLKETGRSWGKGNELGGYGMERDLYAVWTQPELLFFFFFFLNSEY